MSRRAAVSARYERAERVCGWWRAGAGLPIAAAVVALGFAALHYETDIRSKFPVEHPSKNWGLGPPAPAGFRGGAPDLQ